MMSTTRRSFLLSLGAFAAGCAARRTASGAAARKPRILLRSSWQTVNIGDIAHTPGLLALLETHLPEAEARLWPTDIGDGVEEILRRRFPKLVIVHGPDELRTAFAECDFLLHGSGASLVAADDVARWRKETGKPYGIYGITLPGTAPKTLDLIGGARFAWFRDSVSLRLAEAQKTECPDIGFAPDAAFATDLRDDPRALKFLADHGLEEGKFLCCIPRLRYTPYWKIRGKKMTPEDERRHAVNEAKKESDHAPLREAIIAVARTTGLKVLVCPEDRSQMAVGREMLVDPLPADVRKSVIWRETYWLTDEALSVYVRSAGLFGNEMHSPILCVGNGVPAVVCRWSEQTSKGIMWRDIGLGDWLFDMDQEEDRARIVPAILAIAADPKAARARVASAQQVVRRRQVETMRALADQLP